MRIVVLGAGALGSIIATLLARSGEDVVLLARGARAEFLQKNGVTISGLVEDKVAVTITTEPAELKTADLLVVTPKTYDTETALAPINPELFDAVLSVQNGVVKNDQLASHFGAERTIGCIATISGEVMADGSVAFTQNQAFHLGELPSGVSPRIDRLVDCFKQAGIAALPNATIHNGEWSKFIAWQPLMALSVITRLQTGKICADPHSAMFAISMIRESAAIAQAIGVELDDSGPLPAASIIAGSDQQALTMLRTVGEKLLKGAPNHRMSALQDLERGKRLEVDQTLGYLVDLARQHGVAVSAVRQAWQLVKTIDTFNH